LSTTSRAQTTTWSARVEDHEHDGWAVEYDPRDEASKFKLDELMQTEVQLFGLLTTTVLRLALRVRASSPRGSMALRNT
jgi:hypothetical protein